jgi:transposase
VILILSDLTREDGMGGRALPIRTDITAAEMRRLGRRERERAAAARLAGMERQALGDAGLRYNAEGLAGLHDRPRAGRRPRLDEAGRGKLRQLVLDGPDVEETGLSAWTLPELCRETKARWGIAYSVSPMGKLMHKRGLSWQKARPSHPNADPAAREVFANGGCRPPLTPRVPRIPRSA